jgi:phosphate transport system permease protein
MSSADRTSIPEPKSAAAPSRAGTLARRFTLTRAREQLIHLLLFLCALVSIATTIGIVFVLVTEALVSVPGMGEHVGSGADRSNAAFFERVSPIEFFTGTEWTPSFRDKHFGVLPLVAGTFWVAGLAAVVGLPIGVFSAISLSEYSSPRVRSIIKPVLELLAGVPSVVYGYFALQFVTPYLIKPVFEDLFGMRVETYNALSGGIVVGIMIVPMVCSLSEDALRAVPRSLREAGYALGSTKFDVSVRVVLPAAISGIIASFLLAVSRAIGETMAVAMAVGQRPNLSWNPLESMQTMTGFIVNISLGDTPTGSIEYKSLYAVGLTLFAMTLGMNIISQRVMRRYREVYQ